MFCPISSKPFQVEMWYTKINHLFRIGSNSNLEGIGYAQGKYYQSFCWCNYNYDSNSFDACHGYVGYSELNSFNHVWSICISYWIKFIFIVNILCLDPKQYSWTYLFCSNDKRSSRALNVVDFTFLSIC